MKKSKDRASFFVDISLLKRNRNYFLLFVGQLVSLIGTAITGVALPYQIYHQTQSTLLVGLLSLAQLLPLLFTALFGGVLADRHHRRKLLLIAETLLAVATLMLIANAMMQQPSVLALFIIAPLMSAVTGLHRPALVSITQQIVVKKDFATAGALKGLMYSLGMIIGPAIGGLIIAHFGLVVTYFCDFASFVVALLTIILLKDIPRPEVNKDQSTFAALKQGFSYAVSRQELLGTYFVDFTAMIFGMPTALFPAIAQTFGGVKTLGMLYAAPAAGTFIISFFSGWIKSVSAHGKAIAIAAVLWGVAIIFFGLAANLWVALFFLMLAGLFDSVSAIFRGIMWNDIVPTNFRGRLSGIEMISYLSGPKLGDTESGLVASAFGVTASVISGGVLCVVGVVAWCYLLPKFWRYSSDPTSVVK